MSFKCSALLAAVTAVAAAAANPARLAAVHFTQPVPPDPNAAAAGPSTATAPAGAVPLEATVAAVKGVVQVRPAEDQPWQPATVGMRLGQGADVRTGLRSAVQLRFEPDQTITLDRLGTIKVLQAFQTQGKVTTDIGMKYGRTQYNIQKTDLEHASTIRSPGSTLALRGTDIVYEDQAPWVPTAVSREGRAEFRNFRREFIAFGGAQRAAVSADRGSAAQKAVAGTKVDPRTPFSGRTDTEEDLLVGLSSAGGIDAQGVQAVQELGRIGGFQGDFVGVPPVPGPLEVRLDWIVPTERPADLDLIVTDPQGRTATAANPRIGTGSAVGEHSGNDAGRPAVGAEGVAWGLFFPTGRYTVTASHAGGDAAQIFLTITRGELAETVAQFGVEPDPSITLQPGQTFTRTVDVQGGSSPATPSRVGNGGRGSADRQARAAATARRLSPRPPEFVGPRALPTPAPRLPAAPAPEARREVRGATNR